MQASIIETREAIDDVVNLAKYMIDKFKNASAARRFVNEYEKQIELLSAFPFSYGGIGIEYRGYEIEISKIIADKLGVPVKFVTITPINRLPYLEDGTIDMLIANFTITEERKKVLDMTVPYYTDHVSVLVEKKSGIKSLEDLLGTQIAVIRNTSSPLALVQELINQELIKKPDGFSETNFDPAKWTEGVTFKIYDDFKW